MTSSSRNNTDDDTFVPRQPRLQSASYSASFKLLAVLVVSLCAVWIWQLWHQGHLQGPWQSSAWVFAALGMMLWMEWHILRGRTTLTAEALEQTWVWNKHVPLADVAYAKLVRVPGLDWLIAPRLYTRSFQNKMTVIYATGAPMLAELQRLEQHVQARTQSLAR